MLIAENSRPELSESFRWSTGLRLKPIERVIKDYWVLFQRYIPRETLSLQTSNKDYNGFIPNLNYENWSIDYIARVNFERLIANYSNKLEDRGMLLKGLNNLCNQLTNLNLMGLKDDMSTGSIGFIHNRITHKGFYPIGFKEYENGNIDEGLSKLYSFFDTITNLEEKGRVKVIEAGNNPRKFRSKPQLIGEVYTVGISWYKNNLVGGSRFDWQGIYDVCYIDNTEPLFVKFQNK